jgi:streptogramin lyase
MRKAIPLLAILPVVAATAIAGIRTNPNDIRPCFTGYSKGFTGGPTHIGPIGPDGLMYVNEGQDDLIAAFNTRTKRVVGEWPVPKDTQLHDLAVGPDGNIWFSGNSGRIGKLDLKTHEVTVVGTLHGAGNPHLWWAPDGMLYVSEVVAGRLARYNPETGKLSSSSYNLPRGNAIHGFAELPDGTTWWGLEETDQLAHFDPRRRTFDKFVQLPRDSGPHWLLYVPQDHAIWIAYEYTNDLGRYDLRTGKVTNLDTPLDPASRAQFANIGKPFPYLTHLINDPSGKYIWVATLAGRGVLRVDLRTHAIKKVTCGLGLGGITIVWVKDRDGNLWISEPFDKQVAELEQ